MTTAAAPTETVYALVAANLGPFNTVWPYEAAADVVAWLDNGAGPASLRQGIDYTLAGATPLANGGTVTLSNTLLTAGAWPAGARLVLERGTANTQPSAFGAMGGISPPAWEAALDHIERQLQDLRQQAARALRLTVGETGPLLATAANRALMYLATDGAGAIGFMNAPQPALPGTVVANAAALRAEAAFDGKVCIMRTYAGVIGSGGVFMFSAASMAAEDNGLVIKPAATAGGSPGRWLRDLTSTPWVDLKWYGADPTYTTDNSPLFAAWIAGAMAQALPAKASAGRYKFSSAQTINLRPVQATGFELCGDGRTATILDFRGVATYPNLGVGVPADLARDNTATLIPRSFDYFKIHGLSIYGDQPGRVFQLGLARDGNDGVGQVIQTGFGPTVAAYGYVDYANLCEAWDFTVQNFNTTTNSRAADLNNLIVATRWDMQANCGSGGYIGGLGTAVRINNCTDARFLGSWGSAQYAVEIDGGFNEGLQFDGVDMENVKVCLHVTAACQDVKAIKCDGGQWSFSSFGVQCDFAGASAIDIIDPHVNPSIASFVLNGTLTNTSAVVTAIADTAGLVAGRALTGVGVPANTTILSIDSAVQITMSAAATASGVKALTFTGPALSDMIKTGAEYGVTVRQGEVFNQLTVTNLKSAISKVSLNNAAYLAFLSLNSGNGQLLLQNSTGAYVTLWAPAVGSTLQLFADSLQIGDHGATPYVSAAAGVVSFTNGVKVGASQVIGARQTGWGAASSTLSRAAYASYAGHVASAGYVQAEAQATDDALKALSQRVAALITDLTTHGLIGA